MSDSTSQTDTSNRPGPEAATATDDRVIKRFGGRHLIFRTSPGHYRVLPHPYVLISSFRGPIWVFYGVGQLWLTHRKSREYSGWLARVPRFRPGRVVEIVEKLTTELEQFTDFCNDAGIEGTILIERRVIEFHWTFGFELEKENQKREHCSLLEEKFHHGKLDRGTGRFFGVIKLAVTGRGRKAFILDAA